MTTYIALLHSIVLTPLRRVAMADLRDLAAGLGYGNPRTLVSTGNLVFDAVETPLCSLEATLEATFRERFGKPVDIIARQSGDWLRLARDNPFPDGDGAEVIVRVMRRPLDRSVLEKLQTRVEGKQRLAVVGGDLWIDFAGKPSDSRLLSALTTKHLGIGTLRNWNTVRGLAEMLT
jgi:uncharacterized protein (DUF1697 family)